jgi:hypothetical protein
MNNTRNSIRRNKNIGTAKSGYSQDNKLVIVPLEIHNHQITLLVEPTREGYVHALTPSDIQSVLSLVPQEHLKEIDVVVLRQPKKKEEILRPVWGRFVYYADLGKYSGPGVYIEAAKKNNVIKWSKSLTPFEDKELNALESDGHRINQNKRGYEIITSPNTIRNTQLYRTLPHEIGHAIDYLKNSLEPCIEADSEQEEDYIRNVFHSKPSLDKEEYANRYAKEFNEKWTEKGCIPFPRRYDEIELKNAGLNLKWFNY